MGRAGSEESVFLNSGSGKNGTPPWAALFCLLLFACAPAPLEEVTETRELLGTFVTITVLHENGVAARSAIGSAFDEIARLGRLFHTIGEESEVARLNREGRAAAGQELLHLIGEADRFHRLSGGAFDISVQPLLDLYGESFGRRGRPPTAEEIEGALALVGAERIGISGETVTLDPGMKITLGGIAKGYAIDRAIAILAKRGVTRGLVNAGGDMRALGSRVDRPWNIALRNPRDRADHVAILPLSGKTVATSGDYERFFEPTKKFHHIVDPRTGYSAKSLISATVVARMALDADALATAIFVLGPEAGMEMVDGMEGVEALLITAERKILKSAGLRTVSTPGE